MSHIRSPPANGGVFFFFHLYYGDLDGGELSTTLPYIFRTPSEVTLGRLQGTAVLVFMRAKPLFLRDRSLSKTPVSRSFPSPYVSPQLVVNLFDDGSFFYFPTPKFAHPAFAF